MKIRGEALELAFRIVLSCPCDVSHEQEQRVFAYLRSLAPDEVGDYGPVLAAFDAPDTPFHGLAAFTGWLAADVAEATIEREHVLRCNASGYHWQLAAATLPAQSRRVSSVSRWLLSHTVIPALLTSETGASPGARYRYADGAADFDNVFLPPEYDPSAAPLWAIHLGAIVSPLSAAEADLVTRLNEANPQLVAHRARVAHIDYADFELQGDYREFCRRRHAPFWGARSL
jgi:ABC-type cobalt transport system substrate-binding protein